MNVTLAQPRGFCAGVIRAIEIVERVLAEHGPPVYVLHEIVHNQHVVEDLAAKGAVFVEDLDDVPEGSLTIFSAHGVSRAVARRAAERGLRVVDATCPLVTKVHLRAKRYHRRSHEVVIVGHTGHPEVEGTRGQLADRVHVVGSLADIEALAPANPARMAYVTQTTLSLDDTRELVTALEARFPGIEGPALSDICYATQNRQTAARALAREVDVLLVVGAKNSSNSNRLREVGETGGVPSYLIQSARDVRAAWFEPHSRVGVTAGASAPEHVVQQVVARLAELGVDDVSEMDGEPESIVFPLPAGLTEPLTARSAPGPP